MARALRAWLLVTITLLGLLLTGCVGPATVNPLLESLAAEPSGTILVSRRGDLWVIEGGKQRQFTTGGSWHQPRWSPDGTRFAYVYRGDNFSEIFVMNRDGSAPRRLTSGQAPILQDSDWTFSPAWSPDGEQIAFTSDATSYNPMLWVMKADGSGKRRLVSADNGLDAVESPAWSPDGKTLLFTGFKAGTSQIYRYGVSSGEVSQVTLSSDGALDPAWSADGRYIVYVAREAGETTVRVIRADGSADGKVAQSKMVRSPIWSVDGRTILFLSAAPGQFELFQVSVDLSGGALRLSGERQITSDLNADATSGITWNHS